MLCLHPSPGNSVLMLGTLPYIYAGNICLPGLSFQQCIVLTSMLASSSSSHSLGSFPSFSRVGCKKHECVKETTEPHWTLHWEALGESRAALICILCFFPGPYFNFLSVNTFFLVVFSLSWILFYVSLTCKCPPRARSSDFTSSALRRFWGINQFLFHSYSPALSSTSKAGFSEEVRKNTAARCAKVEGRPQNQKKDSSCPCAVTRAQVLLPCHGGWKHLWEVGDLCLCHKAWARPVHLGMSFASWGITRISWISSLSHFTW